MSRRRRAVKRETQADPVYQSTLIAKFINKVMREGKKTIARDIVYGALDRLSQNVKKDPVEAFEQVLENAQPTLEVKTRRIGGANYQVPVEIPANRRMSLAMGWIIRFSRAKAGKCMKDALAQELVDCFQNQGATIKKKDETHRMAEANKAFAHYKW